MHTVNNNSLYIATVPNTSIGDATEIRKIRDELANALRLNGSGLVYDGSRSNMKSLGYISNIEYTANTDGSIGAKVDMQITDVMRQEFADDIVYKPNYRFMPAYDPGRWMPTIRKVIFNDPATIILWNDGTKTVVKAHNEKYDPEKGLAMAIAEKYYGNYSKFKKEMPSA